jgi:protein TonB
VTDSSPFPSFLMDDRALYRARPQHFLLSLLAHALAITVALVVAAYVARNPGELGRGIRIALDTPGPITFSAEKPGGHGGGGTREKLPPSFGAAPKMTLEDQLTPPEAVLQNLNPKLPEPPSVMALSAVPLPVLGQPGDPLATSTMPSNGPGGGGGIGTDCCGGVGSKKGPGFGDYGEGNVFKPGIGGVSAPRPIYSPEPEYSEEARRVKYQGSVVLWLVIGADGRPHNIRVQNSLGMGLDERAIAAVSQWRFQPALLNHQAVAVAINVELSFRLY